MMSNANFNNISVISWQSVLSVEETTYMPQVIDKLYHIMLCRVHFSMSEFRTPNVSTCSDIVTDCTGSCQSIYHTITITTARYEIGIYCFCAAIRSKSKGWLSRNRDNVSEWSEFSIRGLLF